MSGDASPNVLTKEELPQTFCVKYLGHREAKGLWGIKHTRKPVDTMISHAKKDATGLTPMKVHVSHEGCTFSSSIGTKFFPIDTISYGVQDLVYTRVFSMIIVRDVTDVRVEQNPFECHAFVCDSKQAARQLTYCLAAAFHEYSKRVKSADPSSAATAAASGESKKLFAIDLRSPEEIQADLKVDSEA